MADTGDALLREVDEQLRHDRAVALWKQYRRPLLFWAVVVVLFAVGMTQWRTYQEQKSGQALEAFTAAQALLATGKANEAASAFAAIAEQSKGKERGDLAHLWQARALIAAKKPEDAAGVLVALAEHPQSKQLLWRDAACLRLAALDEAKAAPCLASADKSPLAAQRQLTRAAALWHGGHIVEAQPLLEALVNDVATPNSVRSAAQHYLGGIAPKPATKG